MQLVLHHGEENLGREPTQHASRPLAALGRPHGIDPVADGDDGVEVVKIDVARHLSIAGGLNSPELPESCLAHQFGHQLLRQPNAFILTLSLDALRAGLTGEDQELSGGVSDEFLPVPSHRPLLGLSCRQLDGVTRQQCVGHLPFARRATANGGFSVLPTGTNDPLPTFLPA